MISPAQPNTLSPRDPELPHLSLRKLGLQRKGKWVFRNLSLEIPRGKFIAVVGPSGVGKSSLLSVLAGMLEPNEGEVTYCCCNACFHKPHEFQNNVGMIFQNFRLAFNSSLLTNVLCGRLGRYPWWKTLFGFPRRDREQAFELIHDLGLASYTHQWVATTSGGEQQRTAVARAIFQEPEILLADEPISNLDAYFAGRVLGLLRQEANLNNRTVICVLHSVEHVDRFADFVLSLDPNNPEGWRIREITR
jgi:phosphonate transport system ATP-binding protein